MNYSKALSFVFEDPDWVKKLAIGGLLAFLSFYCGLIFIIGFFLLGYYLQILRQVASGEYHMLPQWSNWGQLFIDGILGAAILFAYFVIVGGIGAIAIVYFATNPYMHEAEMLIGIVVVSLIMLFALALLGNIALVRFAIAENFGAAFNFSGYPDLLRRHYGSILAITVFSLVLNGILLCVGLGIFSPFTNFWGLVVQAHLFGQLARDFQHGEQAIASV